MRPIKPDIGHLVRARHKSNLAADCGSAMTALVVNKRGIEVQVILPKGMLAWVRRDQVEVIDGSR